VIKHPKTQFPTFQPWGLQTIFDFVENDYRRFYWEKVFEIGVVNLEMFKWNSKTKTNVSVLTRIKRKPKYRNYDSECEFEEIG